MEFYSYEDLNASFSIDEPIFKGDNTLGSLCQTYLDTMDSFAEGYPENTNSGLLDEIEAFARTDIAHWRPEDCLDWAGSVCRRQGIDQTTIDLWSFRNYSGNDLLQFTSHNFNAIVGSIYGPLFYTEFQDLQSKKEQGHLYGSAGGAMGGAGSSISYSGSFDYPGLEAEYESDPWDLTSVDIQDLDQYLPHQDYDPLTDNLNDMDLQEQFLPIKLEDNHMLIPEPVLQESPGPSTSIQENMRKPRQDAKKKPRGPKNWEFVIRLLADPKTNPTLIRWEDQSQATFRLVQPTTIAQMWGRRSNKPNLTYDNFARGLRYHYSTGALQAVSEKQLVYRCGPKALKYLIELKKEFPQPPQTS